ncbi:MAG: hypothetical protein M9955_07200 [Rhizobiaceae bacterium]|nr:hypothetical protein [Rhizobiaceae bacterium]
MVWFTRSDDVRVVAGTYQFFTGSIPNAGGFEFLIESPANSTDLSDPYYAQFNQENRFINFANNLGSVGAGALQFQQKFGALTFEQTIRTAYEEIVGVAQAQAAGINVEAAIQFFLNSQSFYQAVALERVVPGGIPLDQATKIVALGSIINEAIKAGVGKYATAVTQVVADVTPDGASTLLGQSIVQGAPTTFLLTPGRDFADAQGAFRNGPENAFDFKFTSAAEIVQASSTTLTVGDALSDPSSGDTDVVQITAQGGTPLNLRSMNGLERIEIDFTTYNGGDIDMTNVKGARFLDLDGTLSNAPPNFTGIETTGITTVDASGLTSTPVGVQIIFADAIDNLGRTITGGAGNDILGGSPVADTISGGNGNDIINGFGGNDVIRGGGGDDFIITSGGSDRVVFEGTFTANGRDTLAANGGFDPGLNGDRADFTAFLGGPAVVLEVPTGTIAGTGVDATASNVIIFDNDADINTEQEIEQRVGSGAGKLAIGADRDVVVIIQNGANSQAFYVSTNAAGQVSPDDVHLVAVFEATTSADFIPFNFI